MIPKFRAWHKNEMTQVRVIDWNNEVVDLFDPYIEIPFDEVILMQSTGLHDKNDKEIFDGDILTDGHTTGNIRNHPTLGFYTVDESSKEGYLSDTVGIEDFEEAKEFMRNSIEVIGNIYENPELLEVEE